MGNETNCHTILPLSTFASVSKSMCDSKLGLAALRGTPIVPSSKIRPISFQRNGGLGESAFQSSRAKGAKRQVSASHLGHQVQIA